MEVDKAFSLYFQHLLEALVEEAYEIMQSEFIYKKGGLGKLATLRDRLADPVHGSAIKTFLSQVMNSYLGFQQSSWSSAT